MTPAIIGTLRARLHDLLFERGGLIGLATLVLYVWVAPAHIVDGDNAELATLGHLGGVAHPSGYPLFVVWLRAMSWLPADNPAHAGAIATAILGAMQIVVLHAACRAWGARALAATVSVALFAAGPVVIRIQTEAEVFALNGLICAAILWLAAPEGPVRGGWRVAVLGLAAVLGLSDHLTCVLLAPVGVLGGIRGVRESKRPYPQSVAVGLAALALGVTPYLYLFVAPEHAVSWGAIHSVRELIDHFLRKAYGGPGAFAPHPGAIDVGANLLALTRTIGRIWLWLPFSAGLATLVGRCVRAEDRAVRWSWWMLAASFLLSGPVLAARMDVPPVGLGLYAVQRFYVLPALILAVPVAAAVEHAVEVLRERTRARLFERTAVSSSIATLGLVAAAGLSLPHLLRTHSPALHQGLRNTLRALPRDAVFIESQEIYTFGMGYLQLVEGLRPDVTLISWPQMSLPWYRERCAAQGIVFDEHGEGVASVRVAAQILAAGRPLVVDDLAANIVKEFPSYPLGIVFRILPRGTPRPSIDEVARLNKSLFEGFELGYALPGRDDEFATEIHARYARTWKIIGQAFAAEHRDSDAAWAFEIARQIGPQP